MNEMLSSKFVERRNEKKITNQNELNTLKYVERRNEKIVINFKIEDRLLRKKTSCIQILLKIIRLEESFSCVKTPLKRKVILFKLQYTWNLEACLFCSNHRDRTRRYTTWRMIFTSEVK